jgi:anthranilate/para-aminobenzoate synthase component II
VSKDNIKPVLNLLDRCQDLPILGICFGFQALSIYYGSSIGKLQTPIDDERWITIYPSTLIPLSSKLNVKIIENDYVSSLPKSFTVTTKYKNIIYGVENKQLKKFGFQFHPELKQSTFFIIENFLSLLN